MADEQEGSPEDEVETTRDGDDAVDDEGSESTTDAPGPTVPQVELSLYQLNVKVSGQATDGLDDVESSATRLMDYLIERSRKLEDRPDGRGLG